MKKKKILFIALSFILFASSINCGSDTNSNDYSKTKDNNNSAPSANAGMDRTVTVNTPVLLDGSSSSDPDNDSLSYKWSLSPPAQSQAVLSANNIAKPSFTPDIAGTYIASLIVNDGKIDSAPDSTKITALPESTNSAPVADAGTDQSAAINTLVTLDGSGSSDPDNDSITYMWTLSKPSQSQSALSADNIVNPEFTPDISGTYIITLVVNDGTIDSNPDSVTVTVENTQTDISFSSDVQPLFDNNCTGCHSSFGSASFLNLTSDASYGNLVNKAAVRSSGTRVVPSDSGGSVLYLRINGKSVGAQMPYGGTPLSNTNQNIIKNWIDQGAKNN